MGLNLPDYSSYGHVLNIYGAKANHSCAGNAAKLMTGQGYSLRLVALRDIKKGEEVMWSYFSSDALFADRANDSMQHYCFACRCPRCAASLDATEHVVALKAADTVARAQEDNNLERGTATSAEVRQARTIRQHAIDRAQHKVHTKHVHAHHHRGLFVLFLLAFSYMPIIFSRADSLAPLR
jgi:hypothetical protein